MRDINQIVTVELGTVNIPIQVPHPTISATHGLRKTLCYRSKAANFNSISRGMS
ncbi:hypothetical protein [Methylorubrum aminovorans]|uniref:hypothetical protein n=1 Tax=Methylorubrum aminovorans TaxID=269069 RepID=UPI001EDD86CB|nr:hypothetical protein [Methylorubrum aminovorans]